MQIFFNLCGGDFRCSWQIDHITVRLQEIKFPSPVIAHNKSIYMVFFYIRNFLFPVFFRNYQIYITDGFQKMFPLLIGKITFFPFLIPVKLIGRQSYDQIIAVCFGSLLQIGVPVM